MIVGIVPAAGYATRLQPLPCSKEVYPVRGKPVMDYLLERMQAASCAEIRVVTRPEKDDLIRHATYRGARVILARPASVAQSILAGSAGLDDDDIVLFGFPDTIWQPDNAFVSLVAAVLDRNDIVLGLFPTQEPERSDIVTLEDSGIITSITVKPRGRQISGTRWLWGCGAARARVLSGLAGFQEPGVYFDTLCRRAAVRGIPFLQFTDIGTRESLRVIEGAGSMVRGLFASLVQQPDA